MNALFTKYGDRIQFVSDIYNFDTNTDNIPDNTHIHVWGADATNWNKPVCNIKKENITEGNCSLSKFSDDGFVANNIKYQVLGVFGIVTTFTEDDNLDKLNEKCLTIDYSPLQLYSDKYYEHCKCDWKDSFPDIIEIEVESQDQMTQTRYNGKYKIIERNCDYIKYINVVDLNSDITIKKSDSNYEIKFNKNKGRKSIIIENKNFDSIFNTSLLFNYVVLEHGNGNGNIKLIIKNLSTLVTTSSPIVSSSDRNKPLTNSPLIQKLDKPPIIPLFIYINIEGKIYVLDYKNMGTKDKRYHIYYRNNNYGIALLFTTDKSFIQKYINLELPQKQKFRYSIYNKDNNGFNDVINIFINQINTLPEEMKFSNMKPPSNKIVVKISFNSPLLEQLPTPPQTSLQSPKSLQSLPPLARLPPLLPPPPPATQPKGGNNNSTKLKKKYTYKYMVNKRQRKKRSRKQRGGVFGASQWAPALIGNNITEQESNSTNGHITPNSTILDKMNTFQGGSKGGSKGGNITNVLAQGAVPATLFAANYMYSPGRKSRKRKSRKRKASRKFRLF